MVDLDSETVYFKNKNSLVVIVNDVAEMINKTDNIYLFFEYYFLKAQQILLKNTCEIPQNNLSCNKNLMLWNGLIV